MAASAPAPNVPITAEHHARLRREGPEMLARRSPAWFAEQTWAPLDPALTAIVSLAGLAFLGWPALVVLGFSLACYWNAVLCDAAKLLLARGAVQRAADEHTRIATYWALAAYIRAGDDEMPASAMGTYKPGQGLLADVLLGFAATGIIAAKVADEAFRAYGVVTVPSATWIALAAALGVQWLATLALVVRHRLPGVRAPLRFAAGARGLGLFALAVLALVLQDKADAAVLAVALNVALLLIAAVGAWGTWLMRDEVRWLRDRLAAPATAGEQDGT